MHKQHKGKGVVRDGKYFFPFRIAFEKLQKKIRYIVIRNDHGVYDVCTAKVVDNTKMRDRGVAEVEYVDELGAVKTAFVPKHRLHRSENSAELEAVRRSANSILMNCPNSEYRKWAESEVARLTRELESM